MFTKSLESITAVFTQVQTDLDKFIVDNAKKLNRLRGEVTMIESDEEKAIKLLHKLNDLLN
jgi:hypothetical protein